MRKTTGIIAIASLMVLTNSLYGQSAFTQKSEIADSVVVGQDDAPKKKTQSNAKKFAGGRRAMWIWGGKVNGEYLLRYQFKSSGTEGVLRGVCDNITTVYLNGKRLGSSSDWQAPFEAKLKGVLRSGTNTLIAHVKNAGGPSGFALKAIIKGRRPQTIVSYKKWQATSFSAAKLRRALASGNDLEWTPVKVLGPMGRRPWGNVLNRTAAPPVARGKFVLQPGFKVERLFTVPKPVLGSWVAITFDNKGRLIASDQGNRGLCRITPPPIGGGETKIERLKVDISGAQGLLYAFNSLYVSVNGGRRGNGLWRLRDTNGDDQYDEVKQLAKIRGGGEHGPHALRLSPDGKSIYWIAGNHTNPPQFVHSRLPSNWREDLLLPRQWDARGHARGKLAPGGWIANCDPNGQEMVMVSSGYRNPYDMAFNADGELFAYDADMEWDMGSPWYRPTRVVHATSGSEFGWRSGTGKWPTYYADSLPPAVNIGPGSPVGAEFGYGTKFPAKYQRALYICDWTFGTMYAIHLTPKGSSYVGRKEEFVSRSPLPLTDVAVGPDGALYFTVGGRGAQSELFRVTYVGDASTAPANLKDTGHASLRQLRRELEAMHEKVPASQLSKIIGHLGHSDRHVRYAARIALEHQPQSAWLEKVLTLRNPTARIGGIIAAARQGSFETVDLGIEQLLKAMPLTTFGQLSLEDKLAALRAYQLIFVRLGRPSKLWASILAKRLDPFYPADNDMLNRELCRMLVYLQSPTVARKTIALMRAKRKLNPTEMSKLLARNRRYGGTIASMLANLPDKQKIHYAFMLRNLKKGWTVEQRKFYFRFLSEERKKNGGASFRGFLQNMDNDAYANATDVERLAVEAAGARQPYKAPPLKKAKGPGRNWTAPEVIALAKTKLQKRNFANGRNMFSAARCILCHRFGGEGGATGPDLTQLAGRFNVKDLTESILLPSKVVSDQYRGSIVVTEGGDVRKGKILSRNKKELTLLVDPEDSSKVVTIASDDIAKVLPDKNSLMPADLLKQLNRNEVLDLLAFLLSRGDRNSPLFR